nr:hypothetical protein [uncultured Draconibacterium sp.]
MIKLFSELFTNIIVLGIINNQAILEAITELKNLAAVLVVRVLWYGAEKLYKHLKNNE